MSTPLRGLIAGLAGGLAWFLGIMVIFMPAQAILADPNRQSAKFLGVFTGEPLPRMSTTPWLVPVGLLAIGMLWGLMYAWLARDWRQSWRQRGLRFGVLGWALMVPWFEFYLPFNVLWEPASLVMVEMICWLMVLLGVGLTIAGVETLLRRRASR